MKLQIPVRNLWLLFLSFLRHKQTSQRTKARPKERYPTVQFSCCSYTFCLLLVHFLLAAGIIIYNYQPITNKLAALSLYTISNLTMDNANRNEDIILQDASIDEGERIVVQGFRNLRSQTNWRYRGEAMTISEVMDLESLRNHIHGFKDLLMIVASATAFKVKLAHNALQGAHTIFLSLHRTISFLNFSIEWIVCYIQMRYLDMEDKLYYVRPRNRFGPPRFRRITDLADEKTRPKLPRS